jgi:predicted alpha-1,2-mannosidase
MNNQANLPILATMVKEHWKQLVGSWVIILLPCIIAAQQAENLVQYVKPIIGTAKMGHTFPGATVPFGMVQLSPDTDTIPYSVNGKYNPDVYKYCAGYQYTDPTIVGFSHTHFNGTGHSDLGDFLVMPTVGPLRLNPGTASAPTAGYRSPFSHQEETAEAGYYKVKLQRYNLLAEMTTTNRVGIHQYTFPKTDSAHIILDLISGIYNYEGKNVWTFLRIENDTLITGYRQTNGWGRTRYLYFAASFSKPFYQYGNQKGDKSVYRGFWGRWNQKENFPEIAGQNIRAYFNFKMNEGETLKIKFSLSSVSTEGALLNLHTEAPHWDFDKYKQAAQQAWQTELSKIIIQSKSEAQKQNFYTAIYHAFINPTVYADVDGRYRGLDQNIHQANGFTNYTTFSLWDTYRALHPLFNIVQPHRNADMIRSMLAHYDQSPEHMLPIWSNSANENWCMTGYHSVAVIADAIVKGNTTGFDAVKALDACIATSSNRSYDGLNYYLDNGYIPADKNGTAVSTTLEYAYDDWAIAQAARKLGRMDIYAAYLKRSENYRNVYDSTVGFMWPRLSDGAFREKFDALTTNGQGFIEGNAWNYSLYVPHQPAALIQMMGGNKRFIQHLDSLFTMHLPDEFFAETEDITREGIIGNYVHGNEPSHHVAYLYNWAGAPWKTQEWVRMILNKQYYPTADGLGGNDDCGQMSAWYIFSSLGFYPVSPGSDQYAIGSPAVEGAVLHLENGKTFEIQTLNQSDKNVYVKRVLLNGRLLNRWYLTHEEIIRGGKLLFEMSLKHP